MNLQKLDLKNLGAKHRYYNEVLKDAIENDRTEVKLENEDLSTLMQIEIASNKRNVEYILDVLKSNDLLYVSRAIKKCTWIITDITYAHLIDPEYLNVHLYPYMASKAKHKFHKHVRNNINDEIRAEKFYQAENNLDDALKWLPKCSIPFIDSEVSKHHNEIKKRRLFKKLCERSIHVINLIEDNCLTNDKIQAAKYVQKKDVTIFFIAIERMPSYVRLNLNKKSTKLLMDNFSKKIVANFGQYCHYLDIPTFVTYLKPESVIDFLYKQAISMDNSQAGCVFYTDNFKHFVQRIPEEERFNFVQQFFVHQEQNDPKTDMLTNSEVIRMQRLLKLFHYKKYVWYRYAPFEVSFNDFKHCPFEHKYNFLIYLYKEFGHDQSNLHSILKYYRDKHINDCIDDKISFLDELLSDYRFCCYDDINWSILDEIFQSLGVNSHTESEVNYIEVVIVHKLIKNEPVSEDLQQKFVFTNTFKKYRKYLKLEEALRVFDFIFNHGLQKTYCLSEIRDEEEYESAVENMKNVLKILRDWSKELVDYPYVLQKIKELVSIKTGHKWNSKYLSHLYHVNRSWKKLMIEESLVLDPCEKVFINALKHCPRLLVQYEDVVDYLLCDCKLYLRGFLRKTHIYFSNSLLKLFIDKNLLRLEQLPAHNIVTRNLATLMKHKGFLEEIHKYKPNTAKINWDEEDSKLLSIRRHIAKNMHLTRPHPPPDIIPAYAKGDYLQYAVPSVLAIFQNMSTSLFRSHISELFNSPVSLQKLGIRLAITKLRYHDLVKEFYFLWTNTKNISIRSIIYQLTFKLLCLQKKDEKIEEVWNLLKMLIDNLTYNEDKVIYSLMHKIDNVPLQIKAKFIERNYTFLESYLAHTSDIDEMERYYMEERLIINCTDVIENMNEDFIVRVLKKFIDEKFFCASPLSQRPLRRYINPCDGIISVLSVYMLCAQDEQKQKIKYRSILLPILQRALGKLKEEYRWMENIKSLLDYLRTNLQQYSLKNNMVIPIEMFSHINHELMKSLNVPEYYFLLTQWKLTFDYVKHLRNNDETNKGNFQAELFGKKCLEILKEDVEKHFPLIYLIFYKILYETLKDVCTEDERITVYKTILSDKEFIPGYLTILKIAATYYDKDGTWDVILTTLEAHPSTEVKMNYNYYFNEYREYIT